MVHMLTNLIIITTSTTILTIVLGELASPYVSSIYNPCIYSIYQTQGVCLAVAHSPMAIGNFSGLLEYIYSKIAHRASGNKINNIMVVR